MVMSNRFSLGNGWPTRHRIGIHTEVIRWQVLKQSFGSVIGCGAVWWGGVSEQVYSYDTIVNFDLPRLKSMCRYLPRCLVTFQSAHCFAVVRITSLHSP